MKTFWKVIKVAILITLVISLLDHEYKQKKEIHNLRKRINSVEKQFKEMTKPAATASFDFQIGETNSVSLIGMIPALEKVKGVGIEYNKTDRSLKFKRF